MKTTLPLLLIAAFSTGAVLAQNEAKKKEGPERFADAIARFEANEAKNPPPKDAILFVGSSSIRLWDLEKSFPGRVTLNRGFGGSTLADSIHYFDRIIAPHAPKAIVIYAGDNDVNRGLNADEVFADYKTLIGLIEKKLPGTPVIYIAIKPSIKRWEMWPTMKSANDRIAALCAEKSHLYFADIGEPMLDTDDGKPNPAWFKDDGLHLNDAGYAAWAKVIRPLIEKAATGSSSKIGDTGPIQVKVHMSPTPSEIGMKGYRVIRYQSKSEMELVIEPLIRRPQACPCCGGGRLHSKGRYRRRVRHLESFGRYSKLRVECRRFLCLDCRRSFVQPLPGILPGRHSSEPFRQRVYRDHHHGICGSHMARIASLGTATVERIYHQFTRRKASERLSLLCPRVLGIDEHTLHKSCRFATTFCDLKNHRVFDVVEGKSASSLEAFLLSLKGREKVRVVCIDLSSSYRALIRRYFPNAKIVADRFHVIRIVQHHFLELFRQIAPQIKKQRGFLAALRKHPDRLTLSQRERLRELFASHPALRPIYDQMQRLCSVLRKRHRTARQCRRLAPRLLRLTAQLANSGFAPLAALARTLSSWSEEVARMWRFTKNNGITEGFHRKMKLIQRRAYGFRNFNNYRLRVIAQCG